MKPGKWFIWGLAALSVFTGLTEPKYTKAALILCAILLCAVVSGEYREGGGGSNPQ
jgi:hypothetical protein